MGTPLDRHKYDNAVLYFLKECNNGFLGATKLNKLFYYLDFISYRDRGITVTGDEYISLDYGPVPSALKKKIDEMKEVGIIEEDVANQDTQKKTYRSNKEPNLDVFDEYERGLLDNICGEFKSWNTEKIVAQTHIESPWFYSRPKEKVNFEYACDIDFFQEGSE